MLSIVSTLMVLNALPIQDDNPNATTEKADCAYDRAAMLALGRDAFDQDLRGGWRALANKGCEREAAELIRQWRYHNKSHNQTIYWHEGQMRASIGETKQAIALFKLTYKAQDFDAGFGWNHYVDGTIAFLQRDREALDRAADRLRALPKPENYGPVTLADGSVIQFSWPPNLNVLEGFQQCWDKDYKTAYGPECGRSFEAKRSDDQDKD